MTTKKSPLQDTMTGHFDISNGPGKDGLNHAFFWNTTTDPHFVIFKVELGEGISIPVTVCLNGLERESGSGYQWLFKGFNHCSGQQVHGYYNLQDRTGWIELTHK